MSLTHEIWWYTPDGIPIKVLKPKDFTVMSLAYGKNEYGEMNISMPLNKLRPSDFGEYQIFEVYRIIDGHKKLEGERAWFLLDYSFETDERNVTTVFLTLYDTNWLLQKTIAAYAANEDETSKTGYADDVLKEIVYENLGAGATDTSRTLANLSIQASTSKAPSITKAFSRRILLTLMQDIATLSEQKGTYLAFDIVRTGRAQFEFKTYIGQRGKDLTGDNKLVLSKDFKNLVEPELSYINSKTKNVIYAGGRGIDAERTLATALDTESIGMTQWSRSEEFINASYAENATQLQDEANSELQEQRKRKVLNGYIQETKNFRYGIHFDYGDRLVAKYMDQSFYVHVDAINMTVSANSDQYEKLYIRARGEA